MSDVVLPQTVYRRRREPRDLPSDLKLKSLEWALYFAVTGAHTAAELGRQMRAGTEEWNTALARLTGLGLIEEQELGASEYVRALAAAGDGEAKTLKEFLMGATQPAEGVAALQIRPLGPAKPAFGFKPLPSPDDPRKEKRVMSTTRRLSVRALVSLIERHAGSREAGQLDTYRVFVRVDTVLLRRNGIETLQFTEDHLVSDPELERALVRSVEKTLGLSCPETVWVEVA